MFDNGSFVTLMDHTGYNAEELEKALAELCNSLWIAFQYPILWIVNSLEYEPNVSLSNEKHRKAVLNIIKSLPKLQLIANYCQHYNLDIPSGYPIDTLKIPSQYPMRYRRELGLGENKERYNNIPSEQMYFEPSANSSSATPDSKTSKIQESANIHEHDSSEPKPKNWIDKLLALQDKKWGNQPIKPAMINKLVKDYFGTYGALYCAIEAIDEPDDVISYLIGIGRNKESVANYRKVAEKQFDCGDIIDEIGLKINGITQSKTGT